MRLNQKVRYGVSCLFELAQCYGDHIDADQLSKRLSIPPAYAHKVLQALSHAGMVSSLKGVGYRLTRPLREITALQVINALTVDADTRGPVLSASQQLERRIQTALDGVTLAELHSA